MKLSDYVKNLQELIAKNPELMDCEVIYSSDDEGNDYHEVHYGATPMIFENGEAQNASPEQKPNAVCIN